MQKKVYFETGRGFSKMNNQHFAGTTTSTQGDFNLDITKFNRSTLAQN